jgi:hypothetical protein
MGNRDAEDGGQLERRGAASEDRDATCHLLAIVVSGVRDAR